MLTLTHTCFRVGSAGEDFGYQEDITLVSLNLMKQVCTAIIECCHEVGVLQCQNVLVWSPLEAVDFTPF